MSNTILLVFEGAKTEVQVYENLKSTFFGTETSTIIHATYNTVIYHLWKKVRDDEFLDLVEILREFSPQNAENLQGIERDDVSEIYLFFDYDGHASNASDDKIEAMLEHFNEETENGKLYISYPMVEALKDFSDTTHFRNNTVPAKNKKFRYKKLVGQRTQYPHINEITRENWGQIITENLNKANYIINHDYSLPETIPLQGEIFEGQLSNFITPSKEVAVLSAFPFFLTEYFGNSLLHSQ